MSPKAKKIKIALEQAVRLRSKIEDAKALYAELDEVVAELRKLGFKSGMCEWNNFTYEIRDNFAETNVAFRPAAVRRFELVEVKEKKK